MISNEGLYRLTNEQTIESAYFSDKMYTIVSEHPERKSENESAYEWDEMGMASLFGKLYYKEARFCPEAKSWYTYYDGAWRKDEGAILVSEKVKEFARLMNLYCLEIKDDDIREKYVKFIRKLGDRRIRDRILKDATSELMIRLAQFDNNPYLINCLNGTYNLKDQSFREPKWDDFLTMQTRFSHTISKADKCDRWIQFINEITEGDEEKQDFLQRALGYSILGMSNEECMFILYGKTTRNGKSTLLNTIEYLLGDYAKVAPVGMICRGDRKKDAEAPSPMLAALKGKRFVTMAESNSYGKLDEEQIKQLTGGEEISARALYQAAFTYKPQFSMWLSCNDLPMVTDKSLFASDRIKVIEFNKHFTPEEQDTHLKDELITPDAMKGIFNWLVEGYVKYKKRGLFMSEHLRKVIRKYEKDNDIVLQFLEIRCEKDPEAKTKTKELYQAYKTWARAEGYYVLSAYRFNSELDRHPTWFDKRGTLHGYPHIYGLKLKDFI